jgi:malonyl-CoA O-methyltransferase
LRAAFAVVDDYRHTIAFRDEAETAAAFSAAGLTLRGLRSCSMRRHYPDISALLESVRGLGANRVTGGNRRPGLMGKAAWRRFVDRYEAMRTPAGLPLTYDTIFIYAEKVNSA